LNQFVDFYEIQKGALSVEGYLDSITFNPVASTISKLWEFRLLRWIQNFPAIKVRS
jgi:hypothetical protein